MNTNGAIIVNLTNENSGAWTDQGWIAIIVSIVAIIVSVISFWRSEKSTKVIAEKNLNQKFFETIFYDFLLNAFPDAYKKIRDRRKFYESDFEELSDILLLMMEKASFYKFYEPAFYNDLYNKTMIFETIVMETNVDNYFESVAEIEKQLGQIYKLLRNLHVVK